MSYHKYNEHHVKPSSRGGKRTVRLPRKFHEAWHVLFQDLYDEEIELFVSDINELMRQGSKVSARQIHNLRKEVKEAF